MSLVDRRLSRLRRNGLLRDLVAETQLSVSDLIAPLFVAEGIDKPRSIPSMPGVVQHTLSSICEEAKRLAEVGIKAVILFGIPAKKDYRGSRAWDPNGIVQNALNELRSKIGDSLVVIADLCLDEYTDHGHCGLPYESGISSGKKSSGGSVERVARGLIDSDATLDIYALIAKSQARAGADMVAPSGMMDGQVAAIRRALDFEGFTDTGILAYSAKYASSLYGPFRDAVDVQIASGGDRRSYQQDFRNAREACQEAIQDVKEGADIVMVKPAVAYLDIIRQVRNSVEVPVAAYHTSAEYAMVKAAAQNGWMDETEVMLEHTYAIKRAGADIIITYFAPLLAELLGA